MRAVKALIRWGFALVALSALAILGVTLTSTPCTEMNTSVRYDLGVVLGAGMEPDGRLHLSATDRVVAGVALYDAGSVTKLHFSGGRASDTGPAAGAQMALLAQSMGVPVEATSHEDASQSTLQNALFSAPMIAENQSTILVTEGFHLLRSRVSFWWAGIAVDAMCHSTRYRQTSEDAKSNAATMMAREVAAFWFNLGRAGLWSVMNAVGVKRAKIDPFLA